MEFDRRLPLLLLLFLVLVKVESLPYDVHWLGGPTTIDRDIPSSKRAVDIYCFTGTSKNLFALWQTVKFHIKIKNDEFRQYIGTDPEGVYKEYTDDSYGWSVINPFGKKMSKSVSLNLFSPTCMAINTKERHSIELQVQRVDLWRVLLMFVGIAVIFSSRPLSNNPLFFYLCGILVGVFASFMVLVYYVSKLLPKIVLHEGGKLGLYFWYRKASQEDMKKCPIINDVTFTGSSSLLASNRLMTPIITSTDEIVSLPKTLTYGILIGGWTVGVYLFQQLWENVRSIVAQYQAWAFWYTLIAAFLSFIVCYRIGPPRNQRSKDLVMWTLQSIGVLMIFFSSEYQEAAAAVIVTCLVVKYFPDALSRRLMGYWRRKFPPKRQLLTNEEYYLEGARETKRALEDLRKYCSSPDCAQWSVMLKLNDSKRFASFVEGNSHLSDSEVMDYEEYAFSMEGSRTKPRANSTANYANSPTNSTANYANSTANYANSAADLEISDDDGSETEDDD